MHEMALAEEGLQIVQDAARREGLQHVHALWLEIGQLSSVEPEALRFGFDAVARDSIAPARAAAAGSTHALSPQAVLDVYRQIALGDPPPAFVLCVSGEQFELGVGLSAAAEAHAEAAWQKLQLLCAEPDAARWRGMVTAQAD